MSMNLSNSLCYEWEKKHPDAPNPYMLCQIDTENSYRIYGDGVHEHICQRLEEFYRQRIRERIEYDALRKGVKNPWMSKDHKYYEQLFEQNVKDDWYMRNLETLKQTPPDRIEWYVE